MKGIADSSADSRGLILGLNYSGVHDTAVALVDASGNPLFACALERVTRVKQDGRRPDLLLEHAPWDRIESVAISTYEWPWSPLNRTSALHPTPFRQPRKDFLAHGEPFYRWLDTIPAPKRFICHHLSHAASAFWASGFEESLCLVYDGGIYNSPWFGGLYWATRSRGIKPIDQFPASGYAKVCSLYSIVTALLGFTPNKHEGKVTGLAAHGRPSKHIRDVLEELFTTDYGHMESAVEWFYQYSESVPATLAVNPSACELLNARFRDFSREDIAATVQEFAEQHILLILRNARDAGWQSESICLSGGLFANVKINQRVKEFGFRSIFVSPAMTDDGTALGAALVVASERPEFTPRPARNMFLGHSFEAPEIEAGLNEAGIRFRRIDEPAQYLARRLSEGAVVGLFQGPMEFGPRALGNRSILCQTKDPDINRRLNGLLRRTEFMPFAPITRAEDVARCYIGLDGAEHAAEFMTITCDCTEEMRRLSPAVVHVDGTARPQVVRADIHTFLHHVLSAYVELTGIPSLVNTSFNVHEEPIVCSPKDALRGFLESGVDILCLEGGFVAEIDDNIAPALAWMRQVAGEPTQKETRLLAENRVWATRASECLILIQAQQKRAEVLQAAADERLELVNRQAQVIADLKAALSQAP